MSSMGREKEKKGEKERRRVPRVSCVGLIEHPLLRATESELLARPARALERTRHSPDVAKERFQRRDADAIRAGGPASRGFVWGRQADGERSGKRAKSDVGEALTQQAQPTPSVTDHPADAARCVPSHGAKRLAVVAAVVVVDVVVRQAPRQPPSPVRPAPPTNPSAKRQR
ncbi:hypothetical protein HPB50_018578 [Hyalomma asiaticum]|uniref:Uncharacterized protein n=1 Tax=Hyalomma asiaticum TaxID=266040 RepID=A0ACB7SX90_HYAAI|nr:hypothetical protein HPB50_018578 [Hyalomma asiaticum]